MSAEASDKIGPEVRILMETYSGHAPEQQRLRAARPGETLAPAPEKIVVFVEFRGSIQALEAVGFKVLNQTGPIASGEIEVTRIGALAQHPDVVRIEKPHPPSLALDASIPDIRANQVWTRSGDDFTGLTGNGVVVGIIDTGIEYTHHAFRKADGTTRILAIWDQTRTPTNPGETSPVAINHPMLGPAALGYGVEYLQQSPTPTVPTLTRALLAANPLSIVPHVDADGHGTHVAGIAAGDGSQNGNCHGTYRYIGVAPEADLIIVRKRGLTRNDPTTTGTEVTDAIRYILDRATVGASVRPTAINLSIGSDIGRRDGTGTQEMAIDAILAAYNQSVAIVFAASNEGNKNTHAQGSVPGNNTLNLDFEIFPDTRKAVTIEVRYTGNNLQGAVQPNGGAFSAFAQSGGPTITVALPGVGNLNVQSQANVLFVTIVPTPPPPATPPTPAPRITPTGRWVLQLRDQTNTLTSFHAWCSNTKFLNLTNRASSISANASGGNIIVVGAHSTHGKGSGAIADFSSRGPALRPPNPANPFENIRPHLSAPGVDVIAPAIAKFRDDGDDCCACCCCVDWYRPSPGTSMAAPHVTGVAALMLEKQSTLTFGTLRGMLIAATRTDAFTGPNVNNDYGFGKLDAKAAVDLVGAPLPIPLPTPLTRRSVAPAPASVAATSAPLRDARRIFDPATPLGRFLQTPEGRELYDLGRKHFEEVRTLLNTHKRVATVWHRNQGPLVGHHVIRCYMLPHVRMPVEVNDQSVAEGAAKMAAVLRRYGSPDLRAAVELVLPIARQLPGKNLEEAIVLFRREALGAYA